MNTKAPSRKRPCRVCRKWFTPNPKAGSRQKTCGKSDCKSEWHRRKCTKWNEKNSANFKGNYLQKKLAAMAPDQSQSLVNPSSDQKAKRCSPVNVTLKSGIDPKDFERILSAEQAIVIEYITDQIIRIAHKKGRFQAQ